MSCRVSAHPALSLRGYLSAVWRHPGPNHAPSARSVAATKGIRNRYRTANVSTSTTSSSRHTGSCNAARCDNSVKDCSSSRRAIRKARHIAPTTLTGLIRPTARSALYESHVAVSSIVRFRLRLLRKRVMRCVKPFSCLRANCGRCRCLTRCQRRLAASRHPIFARVIADCIVWHTSSSNGSARSCQE